MWQRRPGLSRLQELSWLAAILCVGVGLRTLIVKALSQAPISDELAYISMAANFVNGQGLVDFMGNQAMYNVGYPLFVLAPVFFAAGEDLLLARLVNVALGGATIVFCYAVAKEAGAGVLGRLGAAAIWALYVPALLQPAQLLKENLMIPLMLGVIWCALRLAKDPSVNVAIGCGVLFGLLALTGNAALSLSAAVVVAVACAPARMPRRAVALAVVASSAILVATPWMVRNAQVLGAPVLNTNGGFNLYLGNNPAATGRFVSIAETPRGPTWEALRKTDELEASATLKREAIAWATEHPRAFVILAAKKAVYFWTPPLHYFSLPDVYGPAGTAETVGRMLAGAQLVGLILAAIASVFFARLRNLPLLIFWVAIAGYTAVHMLFYVIPRYRDAVMPVVAVLAALTLEAAYVQLAARRGARKTAVPQRGPILDEGR